MIRKPRQSAEWVFPSEELPSKVKRCRSVGKETVASFFGMTDIIEGIKSKVVRKKLEFNEVVINEKERRNDHRIRNGDGDDIARSGYKPRLQTIIPTRNFHTAGPLPPSLINACACCSLGLYQISI
ncbi:hypothetical protein EVAR_96308_1 [Eumeta japonica]|uniref:Uncharacterized protein n=1 Tax=Eumeta variegata TaxID=151549 RepID=A0A4C1VXS2_EUMVA|nr:hypothetical protein EVAR_96308_1 [Eumeta japonica]